MQLSRVSSPSHSVRKSSLRPAAPSTIFDVLIADHRAVAGVFELLRAEIKAVKPDERACRDLFLKVDALLSPHARAEEELVYRAFAAASREAEHAVAESFEEHALVHQLIAELKRHSKINLTWCAKAKVLMDLVEHHIREEEAEQFEAARKNLGKDEAIALAAEFLATKEQITAKLELPAPETLELPPPARARPAAA